MRVEPRSNGDRAAGSRAPRRFLGGARFSRARASHGTERSAAALVAHQRLPESFALSVDGNRGKRFLVACLGKLKSRLGIRALRAARQRLLVEPERAVDQCLSRVMLFIPLSSRLP